jgi:four helix bundle protein
MNGKISSYKELRVFQNALNTAVEIYRLTAAFPQEEKHSLAGQMRRSSLSVCVNLVKAWRKRRFKTPFVARLSDSEADACETQLLLELARHFNYLEESICEHLVAGYDQVIGQLGKMMNQPEKWLIRKAAKVERDPALPADRRQPTFGQKTHPGQASAADDKMFSTI